MKALIASYRDSSSNLDFESPAPLPPPPSKLNNLQEPTSTLPPHHSSLINNPNSFAWHRRWRFAVTSSAWFTVGGRLSSLPWAWASGPESHFSSPVRLTAATERLWLLSRVFGCETLSQSLSSFSSLSFDSFSFLCLLSLLPDQGRKLQANAEANSDVIVKVEEKIGAVPKPKKKKKKLDSWTRP